MFAVDNLNLNSKKTKSLVFFFLCSFLVSLIFCGYSAFASAEKFKVTDVEIIDKSDNVLHSIDDFNDEEVIDNITFYKLNQYITYKIKIKNNDTKPYVISSITNNNDNEYVGYYYEKYDGVKVEAGETFDFVVKAILKKSNVSIANRNQNLDAKFVINFSDNESVEVSIPKTGDKIVIAYVMLFVSASGLIISLVVGFKGKKKKALDIIVALIAVTPFMVPVMVEGLSLTFNLSLITKCVLNDKVFIKYNVDDINDIIMVDYDTVTSNLEDPEKRGYIFTGWKLDDGQDFDPTKPLTDDFNLTATFKKVEYNITYNLKNGTLTTQNPEKYTIDDKVILNNPTRDGYTFIGWTGTDLDGKAINVTIKKGSIGDRAFEANYETIKYNITYEGLTEAERTTLNNPKTYTIEDSVLITNPADRTDVMEI